MSSRGWKLSVREFWSERTYTNSLIMTDKRESHWSAKGNLLILAWLIWARRPNKFSRANDGDVNANAYLYPFKALWCNLICLFVAASEPRPRSDVALWTQPWSYLFVHPAWLHFWIKLGALWQPLHSSSICQPQFRFSFEHLTEDGVWVRQGWVQPWSLDYISQWIPRCLTTKKNVVGKKEVLVDTAEVRDNAWIAQEVVENHITLCR